MRQGGRALAKLWAVRYDSPHTRVNDASTRGQVPQMRLARLNIVPSAVPAARSVAGLYAQ